MHTGLVNFRDIGGVTTRDRRRVREGLVFRAGLFSFVDERASTHLVDDLGVKTVVDLRMDHELAEHPSPPMYARHPELRRLHVPFFSGDELAALSLPGGFEPENWATRYVAYTDVAGRYAIARVVEELVAYPERPIVFHCWSGKDRTGITAATILAVLGVEDDEIGADYERSMEWWLPRLDDSALSEGEPAAGYRTVAEVITRTLGGIRDRYGSAEAMLLESGLHPATPTRLRELLLA